MCIVTRFTISEDFVAPISTKIDIWALPNNLHLIAKHHNPTSKISTNLFFQFSNIFDISHPQTILSYPDQT